MGVTQATGIEQEDLLLAALSAVMAGDIAYYAKGSIDDDEMETYLGDLELLQDTIGDLFLQIGELAESPGKADSKVTRLKTRNYTLTGKRTSTVELTINGLSVKQKDYFEGPFSGEEITVLLVPKNILTMDPYTNSPTIVVFNGMRWTVDWSGEADGLWTVVISTELTGATEARIFPKQIVSAIDPEA